MPVSTSELLMAIQNETVQHSQWQISFNALAMAYGISGYAKILIQQHSKNLLFKKSAFTFKYLISLNPVFFQVFIEKN